MEEMKKQKLNIKIITKENVQVVKMDESITFNGGFYKGWAMYVEGLGYATWESDKVYVLDTKKIMEAVKYNFGTNDFTEGFIKSDQQKEGE